jgi:hypothetical protein
MSDDRSDEVGSQWAGALDDDADDATNDPTDALDTQGAWNVESIRDAWHPNTVRLPDSLQRRLTAYHSRIESEFAMDGVDRKYGKDRYYKPLVIALGLRELDAMDTSDVVDALDELERKGHLEE